MAKPSHVHLGQTASPAHTRVFAVASAHAATQRLISIGPTLPLAALHEVHLRHLLAHASPHDATAAIAVFLHAYTRRVAAFIAGGKRHG